MRRLLFALLPILIVTANLGCGGDDPSPTFIDIRWQVRCRLAHGCVTSTARDINNLNGEAGHRLSCSVAPTSDGSQVLSFTAFQGTEYGIELRRARFVRGGGPIMGAGCVVSVQEAGVTYEGSCTSSDPTDTNPCRISGLAITDEPDGPTVRGSIFCQYLPALADSSIQREVTAPGSDPDAEMTGADFRLVNCSGL